MVETIKMKLFMKHGPRFSHSPRFKPWAMRGMVPFKPFQRFEDLINKNANYATFI